MILLLQGMGYLPVRKHVVSPTDVKPKMRPRTCGHQQHQSNLTIDSYVNLTIPDDDNVDSYVHS